MIVALDLDGTLITCEARQSAVLRAALASLRQKLDVSQVWQLKRSGLSTEQALSELGVARARAVSISRYWQAAIEEPVWLSLDSVLPGVFETLADMLQAGAHLALLTARIRPEWVPQQLDRMRLQDYLERFVVVSPLRASTEKAAILSELKADVFIGDSESDWRAAITAGVPFLAVSSGQRDSSCLLRHGCDRVFEDLAHAWSEYRHAHIV